MRISDWSSDVCSSDLEASYINGPYSAYGAPGGSQVFPGFRPNNAVDVSRDSFAGYVEVDGDVSDALSFQLAGRYEHYSDFGDTLNGKVAARFAIVPGVALRGSASTGLLAPRLAPPFFSPPPPTHDERRSWTEWF